MVFCVSILAKVTCIPMSRVVLAMSGGVDSSVAAHLLLQAGHEVIGVFMRHGETVATQCTTDSQPRRALPVGELPVPKLPVPELPVLGTRSEHKQGCCSASDAADARRVADRLDIPFYALNLQADFDRIIDYFVDEYVRGRTPNPCVVCNQWLKFGKLFEYADSIDAQYVATGHYARRELAADGTAWLCRGVDLDKDQSYVLFGVDAARLDRMLLPVGSYRKSEIRAMAAELGLRVAEKRDSQEICFVPEGRHDEFVRARRGLHDTAGRIVTTDGRTVGTHAGIERFTIGQRKGLGVAMGEPYFVVRIDPATRDVVIGQRSELARRHLSANRTNWREKPPSEPFRCHVKIRYNTPPTPAVAQVLADDRLEIEFDECCYGIAPGQAVVCYDGDRVLGGGWIERSG
ncbi:MAG: tRNA 2-thiouridine(34) synthase MnmA [Pirellulaceae bacterium]